ncbi:hypothetical protein Tco_0543378 [Tanacetum coccineum]
MMDTTTKRENSSPTADYQDTRTRKRIQKSSPNDFEDLFLLNIQEKLNHLPNWKRIFKKRNKKKDKNKQIQAQGGKGKVKSQAN